ncbi:MAG: UDP-N-acetylglucosamine 2-epimerase [Bacteroidetes bacterium]|nr:UDP-N-acetylglucosamine 2-epimerase [Bacteroidota bacterium]
MRTLLTVIGTRPQYIKYAAMAGRLSADFHEIVVDTGQHYDASLSGQFKKEFLFGADFRTLSTEKLDGTARFAAMMEQLDAAMAELRPDGVLCFGDTDSTLAAGMAAVRRGLPLCHVEAGERSRRADGLRIQGWTVPEESNRIIIDHLSSLLLCTGTDAAENCAAEACSGDITITGDIMYDLFLKNREGRPSASDVFARLGLAESPYFFSTIHRPINTDDPSRLSSLMDTLNRLPHPVMLPLHPRTAKRMHAFGIEPGDGALRLLPPLSHAETLALTAGAQHVLTDSGGLTREAFFCGVPSLCLDDVTAWHGICRSGWCALTGADPDAIRSALNMPRPTIHDSSLFGDGHAAERIVDALKHFLM